MTPSVALNLRHPDPDACVVDQEQRLTLHHVEWKQYVALRKLLDDVAGLRMTYLEGVLEIMSPSSEHERVKTLTARLLEAYAEEIDVPLNGFGSTTFKKKAKELGLEPDECYWLGPPRTKFPDIAIEVIITSGPWIDRLAVYRGLGVPEVWFWEDGRYRIHQLGSRGYEERPRSRFLPHLDPALLLRYLRREDQTAAVKAFRRAIRRASE